VEEPTHLIYTGQVGLLGHSAAWMIQSPQAEVRLIATSEPAGTIENGLLTSTVVIPSLASACPCPPALMHARVVAVSNSFSSARAMISMSPSTQANSTNRSAGMHRKNRL